ncbi:MAG TPA: J domain-containing protein [Polyangiaceae bacterium]|nr:J domain-containing protein [Polyangiaceae bacterium]
MLLALDRKLSGTLLLETPTTGGRTLILLKDGLVANLRPAGPVARLGELLVELAGVHETTIEVAAATRSGPRLLGQKLVEAGVIDAATLEAALREQLVRRMLWAGRMPPSTRYAFVEGNNLLADWGKGPIEIDPLALFWSYIKVNATSQEIDSALARISDKDLKLHSRARTQRFQFAAKIQGALDVLRARPQSLDTLLKTNLVDADTLRRVLYTLAVTRHLDLGREDLEPMGVAPAGQSKHPTAPRPEARVRRRFEPVRRPSPTPNPEAVAVANGSLLEEMKALLDRADSLNYYQMLGVPEDAAVGIIQSAFLLQAKKWHPDRWRGELESSREDAARVFGRISEAHQVLTNEEQRKEYDKLRRTKGQEEQEQETVKQVLRAAALYQKAQIFAKKQDFAAAEELAQKAFEADPEQTEYGALFAYAATQNANNKEKDFVAWLPLLNRAVEENRNNIQVYFYRAVVLKRAGRINEALRDFRHVNDVDPNNVDAARELRLFKMRGADEYKAAEKKPEKKADKDKKPEGKDSASFLNKLFKK